MTPVVDPTDIEGYLTELFGAQTLGEGVIPTLAHHLDAVRADAGERLVGEGDEDRAMYFVLEGKARMWRAGIDLGTVGPGEYFGEIALVAERPRGATIEALQPMLLARLSDRAYNEMMAEAPALAARFLVRVVGALASRLQGMTESVGILIRDRSLPRRAVVEVRVMGERRSIKNGTTLAELLPETVDQAPVVAGLMDRRAVSLTTPVSGEAIIEPLTTDHWEGQRIFRRSLGLLVLEAAHRVAPGLRLRMGPSIGFAQQLEVVGGDDPADLAARLQAETEAIAAASESLAEELWTVSEAREYFVREGWSDSAHLLDVWRGGAVPMATYGSVYVLALQPMLPDTTRLVGHRIVSDAGGLVIVHPPAPGRNGEVSEARIEAAIDVSGQSRAMTRTHERWLTTLRMHSVSDFNRACIAGDVAQIIRVSEGFQEKEIGRIADEIHDRQDAVRVVCIAGPSSSGKSTFIKRLTVQLQVNGIRPVGISLDDYYVHRSDTPKDADGEYDYESFDAMQSGLLQSQISALLSSQKVRVARYDFLSGISHAEGGPELCLEPNDLLLVEGIHGLNPRLLEAIPEDQIFRIFICPLAQLPFDRLARVHASDLRLLRRIVRDRHGRNHDAAETISRWPSVRAGERKHIFPHQGQADVVIDSSLIYEPSVLKVFAERYLLEVPREHPSYATAYRLLQLVDWFVAIYPDHVPQTSLLREFIGNSGFERG